MPLFLLITWISSVLLTDAKGIEVAGTFDKFIEDVIGTFQLTSPTVVFCEDAPRICFTWIWILCLKDVQEQNELTTHLQTIHQTRKQDGILFIGNNSKKTLMQLVRNVPSIFTSACPVFMPIEYVDLLDLRLDSNIIFFESKTPRWYNLVDIFAVKGQTPITLELGEWDLENGIILHMSMNRWDRRRDLKGATLVNAIIYNGPFASFEYDNKTCEEKMKNLEKVPTSCKITGSTGQFQEKLYFFTDGLNLTIKLMEIPNVPIKKFENGSWTAEYGMLQRKEIDVASPGNQIYNPRYGHYLYDPTLPLCHNKYVLIGRKPIGTAPNSWVYVEVFGVLQWAIFMALLLGFIMALTVSYTMEKVKKEESQTIALFKGVSSAYLFTLQYGSHHVSLEASTG